MKEFRKTFLPDTVEYNGHTYFRSPITTDWNSHDIEQYLENENKKAVTIKDNGLIRNWEGRVWMNPPYDRHLFVNYTPVVVVGISPTWKSVVTIAVERIGGKADLTTIYDLVEQIAPDKTTKNKHFKEKIRQQLQLYFTRIGTGKWQKTDTNTIQNKLDFN